jgi:hypothetical protein
VSLKIHGGRHGPVEQRFQLQIHLVGRDHEAELSAALRPRNVYGQIRHEYRRRDRGGRHLLMTVFPRIDRATGQGDVDVIGTNVWCAKRDLAAEMNVARCHHRKVHGVQPQVQRITTDGLNPQRQIRLFQHFAGLVNIVGLRHRRRPEGQPIDRPVHDLTPCSRSSCDHSKTTVLVDPIAISHSVLVLGSAFAKRTRSWRHLDSDIREADTIVAPFG